jgi:hypothetical protein
MSEDLENSGLPPQGPEDASAPPPAGDNPLRAHAAHHRFEKSATAGGQEGQSAAQPAAATPSKLLHPDAREVLEKLEALDDVVFDAIDGSAAALERLKLLWPATLATLGEPLAADSREQYLRYALSIWEHSEDALSVTDPLRAVRALEVLCVLFDEA